MVAGLLTRVRHTPERLLHPLRRRRAAEALRRRPRPASVLVVCHGNICRSPFAAAALRWKPPVDRGEIRSFLAYLRACLRREAVHTHVVRAEHLGSDTCACLPAGPELLFSGARDTLPLHPESARVLRLAGRHGQALRYGYPLVVLGEGEDRVALPLLTVDVRVVHDTAPPAGAADGDGRPGGETPLVRAVGHPDVNTALLARLGIADPEDLFELRTRLRTGAPDPVHRPAAIADLAAKVRTLLTRLEIERVDDIAPLGTRGQPHLVTTGAHNTAVLFRAGPAGTRLALRAGTQRGDVFGQEDSKLKGQMARKPPTQMTAEGKSCKIFAAAPQSASRISGRSLRRTRYPIRVAAIAQAAARPKTRFRGTATAAVRSVSLTAASAAGSLKLAK